MSTFFGLNLALRALNAQRQGLDVTGHNIANINTPGYSRQRVQLAAVPGQVVPVLHSQWKGSGAGVEVAGIDRLRDTFVDARAHREHAVDSRLRQSQQILSQVELGFAEPSADGMGTLLSDLWAAWGDVANAPTEPSTRAQVLVRAETLASGVDAARGQLSNMWGSSVEHLRAVVADVNSASTRIAELNAAIRTMTTSGASPNDLMDQRDLLVSELARSVGATARPADDGVLDVFVGGTAIVRGDHAEQLAVTAPDAIDGVAGAPVQVRWAKDGFGASIADGTVGGLLRATNVDLPGVRGAFDDVARSLVDQVNALHRAGYDRTGAPGGDLFAWDPATGMDVVITDPSRLAASSEPPAGGPPPTPSVDGRNALGLAALASAADGPDSAYRSFILSLGVEVQAVDRQVQIQAAITDQVDALQQSESGVNLDEELANLVAFQHAYSAAARHLTAVDEMLATLMGTGLVGR